MKFSELGLIAPILKALDAQGYTEPTPIQCKAIPPAVEGRDVLGCAQTGTGKTCAFATPILQRLSATPPQGVRPIRALILTPTRELALQIEECFEDYGKHLALRSAVIFGGVGQAPQVDKIRRGLDILVATPGRLLDLQGQGLIDLGKVEIFVLDEADRMLDMGFIHDVRKVLKVLPAKKQTLFFSATMPPEVMELVNALLHDPVKVAVDPVSSPVEVIDQSVYLVDKNNKSKLLADLFRTRKIKSGLIFTRTKHGANKVAAELEKANISAAAIHGNKSQTARQQALADFKSGKIRALVATDIAARGIDIDELAFVFNYNLPEVPETYVHRIGRTGRAGRDGTAVSFCDFGEKQYLKDIEKLIGKKVPCIEAHDYPMEIFEVAVKDNKGRLVNADDAEARAAARERKKLREEQKRQARPVATAAATTPAPSAKKNQPRWQKVKDGEKRLDAALPERTTASAPASRPKAQPQRQARPVLSDDSVMDATARFLAPRRPAAAAAAPAAAPKPRQQPAPKRPQGDAPRAAAPKAPEKKPLFGQKKPGGRPENRRGRGGPRPVELRPSSVKDSTEQPTLMKPYYLNDN